MTEVNGMDKLAVKVAVEQVLLGIGIPELEKVESILFSKHNCRLNDCMECPEALKDVLCELHGNCYNEIFESIVETLSPLTTNQHVENFINVLRY